MQIVAAIIFNLFISAIAAYVAWLTGCDPRLTAVNTFWVCCGIDAFFLFVSALMSNRW